MSRTFQYTQRKEKTFTIIDPQAPSQGIKRKIKEAVNKMTVSSFEEVLNV